MSKQLASTCFAGVLSVLSVAPGIAEAFTSSPKFIPTFVVRYIGGKALVEDDAKWLAKFDLIDTDRFAHHQINGDTWAAIKAYNPRAQIFLYELAPATANSQDENTAYYLNTISRYKKSRPLPEGTLYYDYPNLFLNDANGNPSYDIAYSVSPQPMYYLLDFGSPTYQSFWSQSVKTDITDQPWRADGIFADNCLTLNNNSYGTKDAQGVFRQPAKYPTNQTWAPAMNDFVHSISWRLSLQRQKLWCNRGSTRYADGYQAWLDLDARSPAPDLLMEEGAFAVAWGAGYATQFYPEPDWKRQVELLGAIKNSGLTYYSHTKLTPATSGVDNYGQPTTFYQGLWYALGSFLLGRDEQLRNAFFAFVSKDSTQISNIQWFDEYDKINLGKAIGKYSVTTLGGRNLYWREFEQGWVLVNPTPNPIDNITQFGAVRVLKHETINTPPRDIPIVSAVSLPAHHSVVLLRP